MMEPGSKGGFGKGVRECGDALIGVYRERTRFFVGGVLCVDVMSWTGEALIVDH